MDIEFHYWITGIIALRAGFSNDEARIIAYSSEYVDGNDTSYRIEDRASGKIYRNFISQTMNILKPKRKLMRIYPIFHFVPGEPLTDGCYRRDGKIHLLNTTPNSPNAQAFLQEAFKAPEATRLYRIGIATHCFVDSWAHRNFVGWYDYYNNIGLNPSPDIGHADALNHPDWVGYRWKDPRLVKSKINNTQLFLSAAKELFNHYQAFLESEGRPGTTTWTDLEKELIDIMGPSYDGKKKKHEERRIKAYKDCLGWPDFDEEEWFEAAVGRNVRIRPDKHQGWRSYLTLFRDRYFWKDKIDKEQSHWYKFQEAVKAHERFGIKLLSPVFDKMGFDLAKV